MWVVMVALYIGVVYRCFLVLKWTLYSCRPLSVLLQGSHVYFRHSVSPAAQGFFGSTATLFFTEGNGAWVCGGVRSGGGQG